MTNSFLAYADSKDPEWYVQSAYRIIDQDPTHLDLSCFVEGKKKWKLDLSSTQDINRCLQQGFVVV